MKHIGMSDESWGPLDEIKGFKIRPGYYNLYGAMEVNGGVNFTIHSHGATYCELCLFKRTEDEPYAVLPFPDSYRIGNVWSMVVFDLDVENFEYAYRLDGPYDEEKGLLFDKDKFILDPYAKAVTGQSVWGEKAAEGAFYKARVVRDLFDWGNFIQPLIPMEDLIIYEMHVRGFTKDDSSKVKHPGTFDGIIEKIPYLKELGVN
nr:glycogen debranching enzyme [Lachnospiraceae bacterium]